jgi:protein involved in polysaccharide export with SLBB domain
MKIWLCVVVWTLLITIPIPAQESYPPLGFGQQPALILTEIDNRTLVKRILGSTRYKLTPGDTYELVVKLEQTERTPLILPNDYRLEIPFLGTYDVRGMYYSDLRNTVISRIKERFPVEFVDFILTSPALFDVFIYGGVENPGIATVTALNRVTEAIALAKGLKKGATYRRIMLKRGYRDIACDLSRFVTEADTSQNPLLEPGDKIYVPHAGILAKVSGQVLYPDTYEMIEGEALSDLLRIAGGTLPDAEVGRIEVARIKENGDPELLTVSLDKTGETSIQNGDRVYVRSTMETQDMILLEATLFGKPAEGDKPRIIPDKPIIASLPFVPGTTVLQILDTFGGPTPLTDSEGSYIIRKPDRHRIPVNIESLWNTRDPQLNLVLEPGDHVFIPMKKLKVIVAGQVNDGGAFPYVTGAKVSDYVAAAGGIDIEMGDPNRIYLVDENARTIPISLSDEVQPGSVIYVDKRAFEHMVRTADNTLTIVELFVAVVTLTTSIITLINLAK